MVALGRMQSHPKIVEAVAPRLRDKNQNIRGLAVWVLGQQATDEAMKLLADLLAVEQTPEVLGAILERQPALQELVGNEWIILASKSPSTVALQRYCPRRGWLPWSGKAVLPQVARSADWFAGESAPLDPAIVLGGVR